MLHANPARWRQTGAEQEREVLLTAGARQRQEPLWRGTRSELVSLGMQAVVEEASQHPKNTALLEEEKVLRQSEGRRQAATASWE
ncbi:unnamed protein product [Boreogadus saida]